MKREIHLPSSVALITVKALNKGPLSGEYNSEVLLTWKLYDVTSYNCSEKVNVCTLQIQTWLYLILIIITSE